MKLTEIEFLKKIVAELETTFLVGDFVHAEIEKVIKFIQGRIDSLDE